MKELFIEAKVENLEAVLDFVNGEIKKSKCSAKLLNQIDIAVEEIFVNIANYAYEPGEGGAVIRVTAADEVVIEFEDKGKPYNPLEKNSPDITANAEERDVGGLGVFMVKKIMDAVEYRHEDNKNILIIKKAVI